MKIVKGIKKSVRIAIDVLLYCIIIATAAIMLGNFFGYKSYVVMSGSMEPAIKTGAVAVVNENASAYDVRVGDIIAFREESLNTQVTHRAIAVSIDKETHLLQIETKGDNNEYSDGVTTSQNNFVGKTLFSVPYVGYFLEWFSQKGEWSLSKAFRSVPTVHNLLLYRNKVVVLCLLLSLFVVQGLLEEEPTPEEIQKKADKKAMKKAKKEALKSKLVSRVRQNDDPEESDDEYAERVLKEKGLDSSDEEVRPEETPQRDTEADPASVKKARLLKEVMALKESASRYAVVDENADKYTLSASKQYAKELNAVLKEAIAENDSAVLTVLKEIAEQYSLREIMKEIPASDEKDPDIDFEKVVEAVEENETEE